MKNRNWRLMCGLPFRLETLIFEFECGKMKTLWQKKIVDNSGGSFEISKHGLPQRPFPFNIDSNVIRI